MTWRSFGQIESRVRRSRVTWEDAEGCRGMAYEYSEIVRVVAT